MAVAILGLMFGIAVACAIALANLMAVRFNRGNALLDIAIRLACFGALILVAAELIGSQFGPEVRRHAPVFWGAFVAGVLVVPVGAAIVARRRGRR